MFRELTAALRGVAGLIERLDALEDRCTDLESRMDTDEGKRIEWVGTVKRVLARINRAEERAPDAPPAKPQFSVSNGESDFAEAQRLGLFR